MKVRRAVLASLILGSAHLAFAQFNPTGTTTLSLTVEAGAAIRIDTATTTLTTPNNWFGAAYTGTTNFTYKIRTTVASGTGTITLQVTADFSPADGPTVAGGDLLTYTCTAASGAPCASAQTASTAAATSVVTFGDDAHSASAGDAGSTAWTLTNDTRYKTGSYNATVTYTISAT